MAYYAYQNKMKRLAHAANNQGGYIKMVDNQVNCLTDRKLEEGKEGGA